MLHIFWTSNNYHFINIRMYNRIIIIIIIIITISCCPYIIYYINIIIYIKYIMITDIYYRTNE